MVELLRIGIVSIFDIISIGTGIMNIPSQYSRVYLESGGACGQSAWDSDSDQFNASPALRSLSSSEYVLEREGIMNSRQTGKLCCFKETSSRLGSNPYTVLGLGVLTPFLPIQSKVGPISMIWEDHCKC